MKKLLALIMALFMAVSLAGCNSGSNNKTKLIIGISPDYAPYESLNSKGEMEGFDIDMTKELIKIMNKQGGNYTYEFSQMSFSTIISAVNSGSVDLGISGFTYDKKRKVLFSTNYYLKSAQVVIVKAGSSYTSASQLKGKTVGAQLGATAEEAAKSITGVTVKTEEDVKILVEELKAGSIDALVLDEGVANQYVKTGSYTLLPEKYLESENKIIAKQGNTSLMKKVDKALAEFIKSKKYTQLREKWGL